MQCYNNGLDIFAESCDLIPKGNANINTHPIIWIKTFDLLNLDIELNYNLTILFFINYVFFFLLNFLLKFKFKEKLFLIVLFFSTTNFALVERLATDLVIFIIVYFVFFKFKILSNFPINFFKRLYIWDFALKYYPIFLFSNFFKR